MPPEVGSETPLVGGLGAVVELLAQAGAQLGHERTGVQAGIGHLNGPHDQPEVTEIGPDGVVDTRVLDLDRHVGAVMGTRPVDLADRRRRRRCGVPPGESLLRRLAQLGFDHARGQCRAHRRGIGLKAGQGGAHRLEETVVQIAGHLCELHQGASHRAEGLGYLVRGAQSVGVIESLPPVRRGHDGPVGGVVGAPGLGVQGQSDQFWRCATASTWRPPPCPRIGWHGPGDRR